MNASFSVQELVAASKDCISSPIPLKASDGVILSFRRYVPKRPCAAVLFFHGGGAHSGAGYQILSKRLQEQFDVAVYTPDIRGHGDSGGPRGNAPSPDQVWKDISTFIRQIRKEHPDIPLYTGGHSSGAGLVLNYSSLPDREISDGYIFISPQLGFRAQIDRPDLTSPFAIADTETFAAYAISGGKTHGDVYAVRFNYPPDVLNADPKLLAKITVNMALALTPAAPHSQFKSIDRAFGLWIGSEDELFLPDKVISFADLATSVAGESRAAIVPGKKHLSILMNAHELIGPWIDHMVQGRNLNFSASFNHHR